MDSQITYKAQRRHTPEAKGPTASEVFYGFWHHFGQQNIPVQAWKFIQNDTWMQKVYQVGRGLEPDPEFNPFAYEPIRESHERRMGFLRHAHSAEHADAIIRMLNKRDIEEAQYSDIGLFGAAGAFAGFLFDPVEWPLFYARTPLGIAAATGTFAAKEAVLLGADPQTRETEHSALAVALAGGITLTAHKLQRALQARGNTPGQSSYAVNALDETNVRAMRGSSDEDLELVNIPNKAETPRRDPDAPAFQAVRVANAQEARTFVQAGIDTGHIRPKDAPAMLAVVEAMPDAFWSGAALRMRRLKREDGELYESFTPKEMAAGSAAAKEEPVGTYDMLYDLVTVFTGKGSSISNRGVPGTFSHEMGHRVVGYFASPAEALRAEKIWKRIKAGEEIDAEFLAEYSAKRQFGEWFAEGFSRYTDDIISGRQPAAKSGLAGIYQNIGGRVREFILKYRKAISGPIGDISRRWLARKDKAQFDDLRPGGPMVEMRRKLRSHALEEEMVRNFFNSLTRRGRRVDPRKFLRMARGAQQGFQREQGTGWKPIQDIDFIDQSRPGAVALSSVKGGQGISAMADPRDTVFHGTRMKPHLSGSDKRTLDNFIDEDGNLHLKASSNFGGRQEGISLTTNPESAADYAARIKGGGPLGMDYENAVVFEIDRSALPSGFVDEAMDEVFLSLKEGEEIVIPAGKFRAEGVGEAVDTLPREGVIKPYPVPERFTKFDDEGLGGASIPPPPPPPRPPSSFEDLELVPVKILDFLQDSPMKRLLNVAASPLAKSILPRLAEIPAYIKRNLDGIGAGRGVDRMAQVRWLVPMVTAIKKTDEFFGKYKERVGKQAVGREDFYREVGRAKRSLDDPAVGDRFEQEVISAAREWDILVYGPIGLAAKGQRMFSIGQRRDLVAVEREIKTTDPASVEMMELEGTRSRLKQEIIDLDNIDIKQSYLNRVYDQEAVVANEAKLFQILIDHGRTASEARLAIKGIRNQVELPIEQQILGHGHEAVGRAKSLRTRTLDDIPDSELEFVLESNIVSLGKYYATRMGVDVELVAEFGSIDLWDQLRSIATHWNNRIRILKKDAASAWDEAITSQGISFRAFRGTAGGGKVEMRANALGEGDYWAPHKNIAKKFGEEVADKVVTLVRPFVIKSDNDLLETLKDFGIDSAPMLKARAAVIDAAKNLRAAIKRAKKAGMTGEEFRSTGEKMTRDMLALAAADIKAEEAVFTALRKHVEIAGHDGIILSFGRDTFRKAVFGKGELIPSKLRNEYIALETRQNPILTNRFSHDQAIVFERNGGRLADPPPDHIAKDIRSMEKRRDQELEDIRAVRDRDRSTYGSPADPESWTNRTIRGAKMANLVTLLTGPLAQVPDVAMIPMVNGFKRTFGAAFETLFTGLDNLKLSLADAQLAGEALDWTLSTRAALFADIGDVMGTTTTFERYMSKGAQMFFNVSGMNPWNVGVKTLASLMAGSRIYDDALALTRGTATKAMIGRLGRANISLRDAEKIVAQFDSHGLKGKFVRIGKVREWTDIEAREVYLAALGKEINLTIITPGKAELPNMLGGGLEKLPGAKVRKARRKEAEAAGRPLNYFEEVEDLFMGPGVSQLIFQFKTFTAAANARILTPGLQVPNMDVVLGATSLVALGALVDAVRRHQLDIEGGSSGERLWSAVEKSMILGWAGDVPSMMSTLADPNYGMARKAGVFGGPIVQQGSNLGRVLLDTISGNVDERTVDSGVRLLPMNNVFYLDDQMDTLRRLGEEMVGAN